MSMNKIDLVILDIQNDRTKNCKNVIATISNAIDWAVATNTHVVYIRQ